MPGFVVSVYLLLTLTIISLLLGVKFCSAACSKNEDCPAGMCCSQYGFCGIGVDFCGKDSTSGPTKPCDPPCESGQCCSIWGFCGEGPEYCTASTSDIGATVSSTSTSPPKCECAPDECCSQWGFCGTGPEFCGTTLTAAIMVPPTTTPAPSPKCQCAPDECCSQWGFCGTGPEYCGTTLTVTTTTPPTKTSCNCQPGECCSEYGYCGTGPEYCTSSSSPGKSVTMCSEIKPALGPVSLDLTSHHEFLLESHEASDYDVEDDYRPTPALMECSWLLVARTNASILFTFEQFDLLPDDADDSDDKCEVNYVKFFSLKGSDGKRRQLVAKFCGEIPSSTETKIPTGPNNGELLVQVNISSPSKGFKIQVSTQEQVEQQSVAEEREEEEEGIAACDSPDGEILTNNSGRIAFQQNETSEGKKCSWTVAPSSANNFTFKEFNFQFVSYKLDADEPCTTPLLEVVYQNSLKEERRKAVLSCNHWPSLDRPISIKASSPVRFVFNSILLTGQHSFDIVYNFVDAIAGEKSTCGRSFQRVAALDVVEPSSAVSPRRINSKGGSWPWMAQLINAKANFLCAATIIDANWLLTAASCFQAERRRKLNWVAVVGRHGLNDKIAWDNSTSVIRPQIRAIFLSALYGKPKTMPNEHDIALIALNQSLPFGKIARPVCLPSANGSPPIGSCFAVSYDRKTRKMVEMEYKIDGDQTSSCRDYTMSEISDSMICSGPSLGPSSICNDNAGSPLFCLFDDGQWRVHGVKSLTACSRQDAGVFTKISSYLKWLHAVMSKY